MQELNTHFLLSQKCWRTWQRNEILIVRSVHVSHEEVTNCSCKLRNTEVYIIVLCTNMVE